MVKKSDRAVPSDLYPYVHSFLLEQGLTLSANMFKKEAVISSHVFLRMFFFCSMMLVHTAFFLIFEGFKEIFACAQKLDGNFSVSQKVS